MAPIHHLYLQYLINQFLIPRGASCLFLTFVNSVAITTLGEEFAVSQKCLLPSHPPKRFYLYSPTRGMNACVLNPNSGDHVLIPVSLVGKMVIFYNLPFFD